MTDDSAVDQAAPATITTPDAPTTSRKRRLVPRTLTVRLVLGVVALVVVVIASTGVATYELLRSSLFSRLDQQLANTANPGAISNLLRSRPSNGGSGLHGPVTVRLVVLDKQGNEVAAYQPNSPNVDAMSLPAADRARLVNGINKPITVSTVEGVSVRVTEVDLLANITDASTGLTTTVPVVVVVGLATEETDNTLHQLVVLELALGGGAVLLALLATAVGVRYSLRPLRNVSDTARAVTEELSPEGAGLDRRVPMSPAEEGTEVGRLAESMNTLLSAVETQFAARLESEHRMRQFLADASHELRTPLTSIRGYAELSRMRRDAGRGDIGEDAETLDRIETEGNRMSRLVEDLLMLARGDQSGELHLAPVDMGQVAEDAAIGARASFPDRPITVDVRSRAVVDGDHDQLLRVVRNLINNACVHTASGGPVQVVVWQEATVVIQVIDSGPGLPPEQAAHVFERFWRADSSRARSSGGSGLGLSIVASIVAAHGGTIRFDSDVETGSTVTVVLPLG